eukprot:1202665-Rhodomonas_salina.1
MTVQSFYELHDAGVCERDEDTQALIEQNARMQEQCASTVMEKIKQGVFSLRTVVHTIARLALYS